MFVNDFILTETPLHPLQQAYFHDLMLIVKRTQRFHKQGFVIGGHAPLRKRLALAAMLGKGAVEISETERFDLKGDAGMEKLWLHQDFGWEWAFGCLLRHLGLVKVSQNANEEEVYGAYHAIVKVFGGDYVRQVAKLIVQRGDDSACVLLKRFYDAFETAHHPSNGPSMALAHWLDHLSCYTLKAHLEGKGDLSFFQDILIQPCRMLCLAKSPMIAVLGWKSYGRLAYMRPALIAELDSDLLETSMSPNEPFRMAALVAKAAASGKTWLPAEWPFTLALPQMTSLLNPTLHKPSLALLMPWASLKVIDEDTTCLLLEQSFSQLDCQERDHLMPWLWQSLKSKDRLLRWIQDYTPTITHGDKLKYMAYASKIICGTEGLEFAILALIEFEPIPSETAECDRFLWLLLLLRRSRPTAASFKQITRLWSCQNKQVIICLGKLLKAISKETLPHIISVSGDSLMGGWEHLQAKTEAGRQVPKCSDLSCPDDGSVASMIRLTYLAKSAVIVGDNGMADSIINAQPTSIEALQWKAKALAFLCAHIVPHAKLKAAHDFVRFAKQSQTLLKKDQYAMIAKKRLEVHLLRHLSMRKAFDASSLIPPLVELAGHASGQVSSSARSGLMEMLHRDPSLHQRIFAQFTLCRDEDVVRGCFEWIHQSIDFITDHQPLVLYLLEMDKTHSHLPRMSDLMYKIKHALEHRFIPSSIPRFEMPLPRFSEELIASMVKQLATVSPSEELVRIALAQLTAENERVRQHAQRALYHLGILKAVDGIDLDRLFELLSAEEARFKPDDARMLIGLRNLGIDLGEKSKLAIDPIRKGHLYLAMLAAEVMIDPTRFELVPGIDGQQWFAAMRFIGKHSRQHWEALRELLGTLTKTATPANLSVIIYCQAGLIRGVRESHFPGGEFSNTFERAHLSHEYEVVRRAAVALAVEVLNYELLSNICEPVDDRLARSLIGIYLNCNLETIVPSGLFPLLLGLHGNSDPELQRQARLMIMRVANLSNNADLLPVAMQAAIEHSRPSVRKLALDFVAQGSRRHLTASVKPQLMRILENDSNAEICEHASKTLVTLLQIELEPSDLQESSTPWHLGALILSHPYSMPPWMPEVLAKASSYVRSSPFLQQCLRDFRRTHSDSWSRDSQMLGSEQLDLLQDLAPNYYA